METATARLAAVVRVVVARAAAAAVAPAAAVKAPAETGMAGEAEVARGTRELVGVGEVPQEAQGSRWLAKEELR